MKAVSPIVEHLLLSASALVFFVFVVYMFTSIQEQLLDDDIKNRLTNLSDQVALKIAQAYQTGRSLEEIRPDEPVVRLYLDLPSTVSGYSYLVRYDGSEVIASSHGQIASAPLLGLERDLAIEGKLVGSKTRKPSVTYYKSQNRLILENVG